MRLAFYALLLANLGFLAASQWLAPSQPAASAATTANAAAAGAAAPRRILLASERPPQAPAAAPGAAVAGEGSVSAAVDAALPPDGAAVVPGDASASGSTPEAGSATGLAPAEAAPGGAASGAPATPGLVPVVATTASAVAATGSATTPGASAAGSSAVPVNAATGAALAAAQGGARRCVSLGPFSELDVAAAATAMLKKDGYEPRQRPAKGAVPDDYLVVIGGLRKEADQERVVRRLNRGGLDDAFPLPKLDDGWAVSVGVFSQAQRAERRRLAVGRMGLDAKVVERTRPGTVYWLDIDLKPAVPGAPDPAAAWLKPAGPTQSLQVVACPQPGSVG